MAVAGVVADSRAAVVVLPMASRARRSAGNLSFRHPALTIESHCGCGWNIRFPFDILISIAETILCSVGRVRSSIFSSCSILSSGASKNSAFF